MTSRSHARRWLRFLGAVSAACLLMPGNAHAASQVAAGPIVRYVTDAKFEDVRDDVVYAIKARGLVVDHTSHIHDMLERTGKDLGDTRPIFKHAEALSFCSAVISRKMMEADPHAIALCPYVIVVYVLANEPKRVYVAFRRPVTDREPPKPALAEVAALLDGIVREALGLR